MEGSDRDSEGSKGGSGLIAASLQQTPLPIVSGNGGGGCGGVLGSVDKVKFTVSVRGHQWSSARHVNETLQEFAATIQVCVKDCMSRKWLFILFMSMR